MVITVLSKMLIAFFNMVAMDNRRYKEMLENQSWENYKT